MPDWLFEESYHAVGDLAETITLLLPDTGASSERPLAEWVESRLLELRGQDDAVQRRELVRAWRELGRRERYVWNKLLTGSFRVGASARLVVRALAEVSGVDEGTIAHRLMGAWEPTPEFFERLVAPDTRDADVSRPYPFYLAYPLEQEPAALGDALPAVGRAGALEGGALPANGVVQAARRAHEARVAHARGEVARRDRDLRRQPRPGARVLLGARGHRRAARHVAGRQRVEARGDAAATAPRSIRRRRPDRGVRRARAAPEETGRTLVHPFDDPFTQAGQGTVGLELIEDVEADVVVVPIGGGGLISGVATAVKGLRPSARVIGVEPETSAAMKLAVEAGEPVRSRPCRSPTG